MSNEKTKGMLSLLFANMIFGMNFTLYSIIMKDYMDYKVLYFLVILVSAIIFLPLIFIRWKTTPTFHEIIRIFFVSFLIIYGKELFQIVGVSLSNPIDGSILATLGPIITLIFSSIVNKEKIHRIKIIGIILGISGALILIIHNILTEQGSNGIGEIFIIIGVICSAINTVLIKPVLSRLSTPVVVGMYYIIGVAITAPFFWQDFVSFDYSTLPIKGYIDIALVTLVGTVLPIYLLYYGTEKMTSVHTALFLYAQPVTATLIALLRGVAVIDTINMVSVSIIFISIFLVARSYHKYGFPSKQ